MGLSLCILLQDSHSQLTELQHTSPSRGTKQQQQKEVSSQPGSSIAVPSVGSSSEQKFKTPGMDTSQLQSMHSMRKVVCSCKTGWNMDVVLRVLEHSVQGIMQSGQESEEALVITRYTFTIKAAHSSGSALVIVKIQTFCMHFANGCGLVACCVISV